MRIRSIKPEFWKSPDIAQLDFFDRLLFIGLWSYVDDNGVGVDRLNDIVADIFRNDLVNEPIQTLNTVELGLERLHQAGRIDRFVGHYVTESGISDAEVSLIYIVNWRRHQKIARPNVPRYSLPSWEHATCDNMPTTSVSGTGEQGNRGAEDQGSRGSKPPTPTAEATRFDEFWSAYPRRIAKKKARDIYLNIFKNDPDLDPQLLIDAATRYANDPNRSDKFTRYPATWLNQGNWEDEESLPSTGKGSSVTGRLAALDAL